MKELDQNKIIIIVGPTASGKSDLAIALAKKYDGEIISADSRQVYHGMDIGSGKVTRDPATRYKIQDTRYKNEFYSDSIRHHLLDVASPKRTYNVTHFVRDAKKAIQDIRKRGKTVIICGGTGFWAQTLIEGSVFPTVKPDPVLRKKLNKLSALELFEMLEKKDPERAASIDQHNKVRLIRALEIVETLGKIPSTRYKKQDTRYKNTVIICLNPPKEALQKNIKTRLEKRLREGMIEEVERLRKEGLSWKRLESFGLEYRYVAFFLQKKISREEMIEKLLHEIWHYAKRQLTWLRRWEKQGASIHWIENPNKAEKLL